ncbi:MAG: M14 family metallopeptidase, partial [Wenzhouxiangellaceae bacterium]|nr:M14 family metallopeptidase [Wenzhouxiangellaceae bacterium]
MLRILIPCLAASLAVAQPSEPFPQAPLPPAPEWSGASEALVAEPGDPWITPSEESGLTRTPDYEATMAWLDRLVAAAPELSWIEIGTSAQGRAIRMIVADREGLAAPEAVIASGRARVLAHAGIHAGEIDGKDAGMMLLRDMTVAGRRSALLEDATLLFIPILNVDGHERRSRYNRMNQRGPEVTGWRTNARNLNLNRDYAKLDTEGVRALVGVVEAWQPELYLDLHVTDGADYQYDITYGWNGPHAWSPDGATWLDEHFRPAVDEALSGMGHVPGPLIFSVNGLDMKSGMASWSAGPRYSNGWGDARHLPTVLFENHSLKPYRQRVLGTYVFLAAALEAVAADIEELRAAIAADRVRNSEEVALSWTPADEPAVIDFAGVESERFLSEISGGPIPEWTGEPTTLKIPRVEFTKPGATVTRPAAYLIPPQWADIAGRLRLQGITVERLAEPKTMEVEIYHLPDARLDIDATPFEGRARYASGQPEVRRAEVTLPAGSFRVPADQPLGTLAVLLLEPQSPDSYFAWGDFASILQRTEYFEEYAMEPLARQMLDADPD